MSDSARPRGRRDRWASDHERARQRAAERLSLPLPAAENAWLDRHLRSCAACAVVAAEYAAQQASLNGLKEPLPPRDMWARTSAALDRAERQAGRSIPNPSVFPGRGGPAGSRGSRSIRGLRAEQRASAFRAGSRAVPPRLLVDRQRGLARPAGLGWVVPFGALAALAIVIVVGGSAMLTGTGFGPARGPLATAASLAANVASTPFATPIQVGAGEVAWLTPADDGTYSLNLASVSQVCPTNAQPDCAPIAPAAPRQLPTVKTTLHTVLRSPSHKQLVVVTTGTKKRSGGSVLVVAVPTPVAIATAGPTDAAGSPQASPPATPTATAVTPPSPPGASTSATPSGDAAPTTTPARTNPGPTPDPSAAVTPTDSASAGTSELPSAVVDSSVPASTATVASPAATDGASPSASESPAPSATAPGGSSSPGPTGTPSDAAPSDGVAPAQPEPTATATALAIIDDVVVVGETASYSPDGTMLAFSARPANGSRGPDIYLWRPGDPTAHPVTTDHASVFSGWLNNQLLGSRAVTTVDPSASGLNASPAASGGSSDAPSSAAGDGAGSSAGTSAGSAGTSLASDVVSAGGSASVQFVALGPSGVLAQSFVLDPATGTEADLAASAWRPVVDPTGRFVAYWAGSLRYDASNLTWIPDHGAIVLASWTALRGTDPNATLAPVPLLDNGGGAVPPGEWDIRWDESGQHIAIWAADANNPDLGRLTILTIDSSGRVDPNGIALHDAPALAGFSIGSDRLAWATPPGQDGEGSRLQVLAWSGENAGKIDSQPVSGGDAVVVVR